MASAADQRTFFLTAISIVVVDFITKQMAEAALLRTTAVSVIGDWVQLRLVYNPGAAFGLSVGDYSRWVFFGFACVALVALFLLSRETPSGMTLRQFIFGAIAGGAAGNLVDRVRSSRGVIDFLDVGIGTMRWPTFNVADIAVSCGAVALAISFWRDDAQASETAPAP